MRRICALALLAALGAALLVSPEQSSAGSPVTIDKVIPTVSIKDSARDRDFASLVTLFPAANINSGETVGSTFAKSLLQYGRGTIHLTWGTATAADSDSVNVSLSVVGRSAVQGGISYNWSSALSSFGSAVDSCSCPSGGNGGSGPAAGQTWCLAPTVTYYITRNSLTVLKRSVIANYTASGGTGGASTHTCASSVLTMANPLKVGAAVSGTGIGAGAIVTAISSDGLTITTSVVNSGAVSGAITSVDNITIRKIPLSIYRYGAGVSGISFPLADISGAYPQFEYVAMYIQNLHPRKNLTSVQCDAWMRVN